MASCDPFVIFVFRGDWQARYSSLAGHARLCSSITENDGLNSARISGDHEVVSAASDVFRASLLGSQVICAFRRLVLVQVIGEEHGGPLSAKHSRERDQKALEDEMVIPSPYEPIDVSLYLSTMTTACRFNLMRWFYRTRKSEKVPVR